MKIKSVIRKAVASNLSIEELFAKGDLKLSEMRAVLEAMSSKHDGDLMRTRPPSCRPWTREIVDHFQATFRVCVDVQEEQNLLQARTPEVLLFARRCAAWPGRMTVSLPCSQASTGREQCDQPPFLSQDARI